MALARVFLTAHLLALASQLSQCRSVGDSSPGAETLPDGGASGFLQPSINIKDVEMSLRMALEAELDTSRAWSGSTGSQLHQIEQRMRSTYEALPKNAFGRLGPKAVRYIVHNYFAREHGWLLRGLEPNTAPLSAQTVQSVNILQDKAPALVEALLEAQQHERGLNLPDVAAMIKILEQLIFEESAMLLDTSYHLTSTDPLQSINEDALHKVLRSFLMIFRQSPSYNRTDVQSHQIRYKRLSERDGPLWRALVDFESDAVYNRAYEKRNTMNPFVSPHYKWESVLDIALGLTEAYGKWQHLECLNMKSHLMDLDPLNSGRVPLSVFHSQPRTAKYSFTETASELREHGLLDETNSREGQVLIANYLLSPTNCIAEGTYFSVCCLSECEVLLNELESAVKAPTAPVDVLLPLVGNLSEAFRLEDGGEVSEAMASKLRGIASKHDGEVPLHGRLFAQWLHYVFPTECPYPRAKMDNTALTPSQWLSDNTSQPEAVATPSLSQWSDEENLPLLEQKHGLLSWFHHDLTMRDGMRITAACVAVLVGLHTAVSTWKVATETSTGPSGKKPRNVLGQQDSSKFV